MSRRIRSPGKRLTLMRSWASARTSPSRSRGKGRARPRWQSPNWRRADGRRTMPTYASILVEECGPQLSPVGQDYLRRIRVASDLMDRLIRDVLVFSRVSREKMPLERVELGSFISNVIESYPGLNDTSAQIE